MVYNILIKYGNHVLFTICNNAKMELSTKSCRSICFLVNSILLNCCSFLRVVQHFPSNKEFERIAITHPIFIFLILFLTFRKFLATI